MSLVLSQRLLLLLMVNKYISLENSRLSARVREIISQLLTHLEQYFLSTQTRQEIFCHSHSHKMEAFCMLVEILLRLADRPVTMSLHSIQQVDLLFPGIHSLVHHS